MHVWCEMVRPSAQVIFVIATGHPTIKLLTGLQEAALLALTLSVGQVEVARFTSVFAMQSKRAMCMRMQPPVQVIAMLPPQPWMSLSSIGPDWANGGPVARWLSPFFQS